MLQNDLGLGGSSPLLAGLLFAVVLLCKAGDAERRPCPSSRLPGKGWLA